MKNKKIFICLLMLSFVSACQQEDYSETFYIPEYEKFILKPGAKLIFQSEHSVNDTFVVDSVNYSFVSSFFNNDLHQSERVYFKKQNAEMPFKYSFKKSSKYDYDARSCYTLLYFNNDTISNDFYYYKPSILINYNVNGKNYPYVEYINKTKNGITNEFFYNHQYGIIKYRLQDSIVWSLNKIIE